MWEGEKFLNSSWKTIYDFRIKGYESTKIERGVNSDSGWKLGNLQGLLCAKGNQKPRYRNDRAWGVWS